jgi:hypothetical protein
VATFNPENPDYFRRIDWAIFQNGWVVMYWRSKVLESDVAWLFGHEYRVYRFNCERWSSRVDALAELGVTLEFPDYYGQNLDAFNDCLSELEVPVEGGAAIVLLRYDVFAERDPGTAQTILDICANNARRFMLFGQRFATLVQSDDPRLSFEPVGATPILWNRREWLNKSRGV